MLFGKGRVLLLIGVCFLSIEAHASQKACNSFGALGHRGLRKPTVSKDGDSSVSLTSPKFDLEVARGGAEATAEKSVVWKGLIERAKIASYFALWYALNIVYNISNKKLLNVIPAPLTVGTLQFFVGALYASTLWVTRLRPAPKLTSKGKEICSKIGFYHAVGQLLSMVSLGAGPVSFTHIVKALEPFFSAIVSALVFGKWMKPQVYATLIPVVCGVGYACMKERSFSWLAFYTAMGSNLAFALRAVVSKTAMTNYIGENLSSANLFGVVTLFAAFLSVPIVMLGEGYSMVKMWTDAVAGGGTTSTELIKAVIVSGLFHYLNNEVMYLALSNVHPVTLAVGNTMKRVFIMVASVLVFRNPVSVQAGIGSAIGISGVLLYSLTKQHYEKLEAASA
eukprot:CAMPEP_0195520062 /NCGR_PEP_ID=MMETSP0794_2-20130614/16019_1 /TAXON_ID=515487 /ORGANISM="Stephanopyxis turris, Strain CCMP 815" /LENGTH=393 /DNA_ID=CAMNT_0040649333 /DNA_START=150 /DNA_END=1331 /DNA_ORIENTATION=+